MKHIRILALAVVTGLMMTACSLVRMNTHVTEFRSKIPGDHFKVVMAGPVDPNGFDVGIASRVRVSLRKQGVNVIPNPQRVGEGDAALEALCPKGERQTFDGVLFVSYDRLILRDCDSHIIAYSVEGGFVGIDELTKRFVRYLKTQPG